MNRANFARISLWVLWIGLTQAYGVLCPTLYFDVTGPDKVCVDAPMNVSISYEQIEGDCNGLKTYPYVRVYWTVTNVVAEPQSGMGSVASFRPLTAGNGAVIFRIVCRSNVCPDCNQEFYQHHYFDAVKAEINANGLNVCVLDTSAYLTVAADSYSPDGYVWSGNHAQLNGEGSQLEIDPSQMPVGGYTVQVSPKGLAGCSATATLNVKCCFSFAESEVGAAWVAGGSYNARNNLTSESSGWGDIDWTITTMEGGDTVQIDHNGLVTFGSKMGGWYTIRATPKSDPTCYDEMQLIVFWAFPLVDANYDGAIDPFEEEWRESPGGLVNVNANDDNRNGIPDKDEDGPIDGEEDLERVKFSYGPKKAFQDDVGLTLYIARGEDKIRLWLDPYKSTPLEKFEWTVDDPPPDEIYVEAIKGSASRGDIGLELCFDTAYGEYCGSAALTALNIQLVPDWNRNRTIDESDENQATHLKPFRFWINDDNDSGDEADGNSDLPGQPNGNASDFRINGRSDLLDFFPVWLDIGNAAKNLKLIDEEWTFVLKQDDDALNGVYTDLTTETAGDYQTHDFYTFGRYNDEISYQASVFSVNEHVLDEDFWDYASRHPTQSILLFEGKQAGSSPLTLEVQSSSGKVVARAELPMIISSVEDMYRAANFRGDADPGILPPPPNYPDELSSDKNFVFVHGNNASLDTARAWGAEVFKRMWQSGSQYKFHAVYWPSDRGLATSYQEHVLDAFQMAPRLAQYVNGLPGNVVIAAQSLGNIVCGSAIQDYGMKHSTYYMLNAAVAQEAYDATLADTPHTDMVHPDWVDYAPGTWAANWYRLFEGMPTERSRLTWHGRFEQAISKAYNIYSDSDEIFDTTEGVRVLTDPNIFSDEMGAFYHYSWQIQEMLKGLKGRPFNGALFGLGSTDMAGWAFSLKRTGLRRYYPQKANETLTNNPSLLMTEPVFRPRPEELFLYMSASKRDEILAKGIPALTRAAGVDVCDKVSADGLGNINLNEEKMKPNGTTRTENAWHHNDMKALAYFYTYKLYESLVK